MMRFQALIFGLAIGLFSHGAAACSSGFEELDLRRHLVGLVVDVRSYGQQPHPERPGFQQARVRIEAVLRGPDLPSARPVTATVVFASDETRGPTLERGRRYILGLWLNSDTPDVYSEELRVYGGGGFCIGQMIYPAGSRMAAALSLLLDDEGDVEVEINVLNSYLRASSDPSRSGYAAITMLFDGEGDQATELEILRRFEELQN